jgi:hypothetical protein
MNFDGVVLDYSIQKGSIEMLYASVSSAAGKALSDGSTARRHKTHWLA